MVHCGVASSYLHPAYPTKGDYSSESGGDYIVPGGYTRRRRNIGKFDIGAIPYL
jgi:hypothetical protein